MIVLTMYKGKERMLTKRMLLGQLQDVPDDAPVLGCIMRDGRTFPVQRVLYYPKEERNIFAVSGQSVPESSPPCVLLLDYSD